MNDNLLKLFKQALNHPNSRLTDDIWRAIQVRQARNLKIQSLIYGIIGVLSLGGFVFVSISLKKEFISSGFFNYMSLIFSDGSLISVYWREYLLSLSDSLPVASLGTSVFLLFSILISVKKVVHQYKNNQLLIN